MRQTSAKVNENGENPTRKTREEKMESIVLASGEFGPEDIVIQNKRSNRIIDPKIESEIPAVWRRIQKTAKLKGKRCYNGTLYRLNKIEALGVTEKAGAETKVTNVNETPTSNGNEISEPEEREKSRCALKIKKYDTRTNCIWNSALSNTKPPQCCNILLSPLLRPLRNATA